MSAQSDRIKRLRKYANMTQKQFASYTGVPLNTLKKWESNVFETPAYVMDMLEASVMTEVENNHQNVENKERRLMAYYEAITGSNIIR
jgi:transcriptional regulator with XRE-family HTH domain